MEPISTKNLAETLATEMKAPIEIASDTAAAIRRVALPPGWKLDEHDDEKLLAAPLRKRALVRLRDSESFIDYVKRHGSLDDCTIWCLANYVEGRVAFTAIINDNGSLPTASAWRDHKASFTPEFSEEWRRWTGLNKKQMTQTDFAAFLEDNLRDVAAHDGSNLPSGAAMRG